MRGVIYTRVSTEGQEEGHSLDEQLRRCQAKLEMDEVEFVNHYEDIGSGSAFENRPGYVEMMSKAGTEWDLIVVYKVDRIHRSLRNMVLWLDDLRELECDFLSATEPVDTSSAQGAAFLQMLGVFAELERRLISDRVRMGMSGAKRKGRWVGTPPYGYSINADFKSDGTREAIGELTPNFDEAKAVKVILLKYAEGQSISAIITSLVEAGHRTRSGFLTWHRSTVEGIINRMPLYVLGAIDGKPGKQTPLLDLLEHPILHHHIDYHQEAEVVIGHPIVPDTVSFRSHTLASRRSAWRQAETTKGNPTPESRDLLARSREGAYLGSSDEAPSNGNPAVAESSREEE